MPTLHPTALVSSDAKLAEDVTVGPFAVIEGPVVLEKGVTIGGHAWITGDVVIGENSHIGWGSIIGADPQDLSFDPATKSGVRIGVKNTLREYVTLHRGSKNGGFTTLGESNFLMTGVHLAHDVQMGRHNVIANNVLLAGHILIGDRVFLGGGAGFHQFIHIGDYAIAQGNAAISQDIPPYHLAHGQNQLAGLNVIGLRRGGFDQDVRAAIKSASKLLFFSGHPISHALELAALREWPEAVECLIKAVKHPSRKGVMTK
jgi:UDP-N-acetylglucosamine acyltransferase